MKNILKIFLFCLLVVACKGKNETNFVVITDNGKVEYNLQSAQDPEELMKGLMYVENMPDNEGMIFDLSGVSGAAMWMKDTKISLDMIFADAKGNIVWIYEKAEPMSEDLIVSPVPFSFVVELNAGQVEKNKIKVGDKLEHEFFNNFNKK